MAFCIYHCSYSCLLTTRNLLVYHKSSTRINLTISDLSLLVDTRDGHDNELAYTLPRLTSLLFVSCVGPFSVSFTLTISLKHILPLPFTLKGRIKSRGEDASLSEAYPSITLHTEGKDQVKRRRCILICHQGLPNTRASSCLRETQLCSARLRPCRAESLSS